MEGEDEESNDERAFNNKPAWQKAIILVAGAGMNVITAVILVTIVVFVSGVPTTTIGDVIKDSPAELAGIMPGDRIVRADDREIDKWEDFTLYIDESENDSVKITVERDNREIEVPVKIAETESGDRYIGANSQTDRYSAAALVEGPKATWDMTVNMYSVLKDLVTGNLEVSNLSGPVGIVYMVDQSVSQGVITFLYFMALISLNLAVVNLLPFPALDGGRLIFVIIRKITGKAITDNMEAVVHMAGMACLLLLMLYVTWQDILRFIMPIFR